MPKEATFLIHVLSGIGVQLLKQSNRADGFAQGFLTAGRRCHREAEVNRAAARQGGDCPVISDYLSFTFNHLGENL